MPQGNLAERSKVVVNLFVDCPWRLVVSDLDGTLVTGTTALDHLGAWIGHRAIIEGLEDRFTRGEISDREVAEGYAPFYEGVAQADAVDVMARIPRLDDIGPAVAMLRQRSVDAFIATVSWSFAAQALADVWGFSQVYGAELELDGASGLFTGRVARHFDPEDKVAVVADHCRRAGIGMEQVVAIGDGRSDLPLFRAVGFSVALNASSAARAAASTAVEGTSFLAALHAVPHLLEVGQACGPADAVEHADGPGESELTSADAPRPQSQRPDEVSRWDRRRPRRLRPVPPRRRRD